MPVLCFRDGATLAALEEVTGAKLADLTELIDKSWLQPNISGRHKMHEVVRQYCIEKLESEHHQTIGEHAEDVRRRHRLYYSGYLKRLLGELNYDPQALKEILAEFDNLLAALHNAVDEHDMQTALDICFTIYFVGDMMGWLHFSIETMDTNRSFVGSLYYADAALKEPERTEVAHALAGVRHAQFHQYRQLGLYQNAVDCSKHFASLVIRMGPGRERTYWSAFGAAHEANLAYDNGDYLTSRDLRQESLALFAVDGFDCFVYGRKRGVTYWQAQVYAHMGLVNWALGDYTRSEACYECSMKLRKDDGERRSQGVHMVRYARLLQTKGAYARAEDLTR